MKSYNFEKVIVLIGPPGSGKGAQSALLSKKLNLPVIELGDLVRKKSNENSKEGKLIKDRLKKGKLLPDKIIISILENEIKKIKNKNGFILDGFPRTIKQAKFLNRFKNKLVIYFKVNITEIIKRLSKRLTCPSCGGVFIDNGKIKKCPDCKVGLIRREDDKPKIIRNRINVFKEKTKPIISYLEKQKSLIKIDGNPSIPLVFKELWQALKIRDNDFNKK